VGFVEFLEDAGLDLPLQEICGWHDYVVTGFSREQLGLERLIGIKRIVLDLDTGILCKVFKNLGVDIVGPVIDIHHTPALGRRRVDEGCANAERQRGSRQNAMHGAPQAGVIQTLVGRPAAFHAMMPPARWAL